MSNKLVKRNNMENVTFAALGLDINTNFLEAPLCDGCGNKQVIYTEDIQSASGQMLRDLSKHSLHECDQVLQESLQTMEKELGMEAGYLDLKHCGILVEIAKDTYKVLEE